MPNNVGEIHAQRRCRQVHGFGVVDTGAVESKGGIDGGLEELAVERPGPVLLLTTVNPFAIYLGYIVDAQAHAYLDGMRHALEALEALLDDVPGALRPLQVGIGNRIVATAKHGLVRVRP